MKHLLSFFLFTFLATNVQAYIIRGARDCGQYVKDYNEDGWPKMANTSWLLGGITGYNAALDQNVGKAVGLESIELHVNNYCKENPLNDTADALLDLILQLQIKEKNLLSSKTSLAIEDN